LGDADGERRLGYGGYAPAVQAEQPQPFTLPFAEAFDVTTSGGRAYRLSVGLPRSYGRSDRRYPVLYVLDADDHFLTVLDIARLRGMLGEVQELVVVGIGYPRGTDLATYATRRMYDFSTDAWDRTTTAYREQAAMMELAGLTWEVGGAPAFLAALVDELQPLIAERYSVDPADQGLFGTSAGGNFTGYALFERPDAFAKYIVSSPAFYFSDFEVLRLEERYAAGAHDLPATVYLGAGVEETRQYAQIPIVSGLVRLAEALERRRYPGLLLRCELYPGKGHLSAATEAIDRGLEACWPGVPVVASAAAVEENDLPGLLAEQN
jgi:predicted alpha/beta superfamily hydrolase